MKSSGDRVMYLRCIEPASEEYGSWFECGGDTVVSVALLALRWTYQNMITVVVWWFIRWFARQMEDDDDDYSSLQQYSTESSTKRASGLGMEVMP
eukprot:scaffold13395_cov71-Cyclotella_meneghiniana.AAC.9